MVFPTSALMSVVARCMQQQPAIQIVSQAIFRQPWPLPAHPCASLSRPSHDSSSSTVTGRCFASSSSSDGAPSPGSSTQPAAHQPHEQHQQRQQQQSSQAAAAFSTAPDAFTASLQSKTESEVFSLLEKARAAKMAEAAAAAAAAKGGDAGAGAAAADAEGEAREDDTVDVVNPETGEAYGPRGKEPTRYGDWEIKGRCTDFS